MKKSKNRFLTSVLFCLLFSSTQAAMPSNYAEMGLALATIPFDMAAQHNELNNNKKAAALLHLTADSVSILNKAFFVYNNAFGLNCDIIGLRRDLLVNGALGVRDITKWFGRLKECFKSKEAEQSEVVSAAPESKDGAQGANAQQNLDQKHSQPQQPNLQAVEFAEIPENQIDKLAYAWQVLMLPSLKGFTAFAVACTQNHATQYASKKARNLATAAHSFTKLLDEYNTAPAGSNSKKVVTALLFVNAAWLVYELKNYLEKETPKEEEKAQPVEYKKGKCPICVVCGDEDDKDLIELGCKKHAYCEGCLVRSIRAKINDDKDEGTVGTVDIKCPDLERDPKKKCKHKINIKDIRKIRKMSIVDDKTPVADNEKIWDEKAFIHYLKAEKKHFIRTCPKCDYKYVVKGARGSKMATICPGCKHKYCTNCNEDHDQRKDCKKPLVDQSEEFIKQITQVCPSCGKRVERVDGTCKYMHCKCGQGFCFYCGVKTKGHKHPVPDCHNAMLGDRYGFAARKPINNNPDDSEAEDSDDDEEDNKKRPAKKDKGNVAGEAARSALRPVPPDILALGLDPADIERLRNAGAF